MTAEALESVGCPIDDLEPAEVPTIVADVFGCTVTHHQSGWLTARFAGVDGQDRTVHLVLLPFLPLEPSRSRPGDMGVAGIEGTPTELPDASVVELNNSVRASHRGRTQPIRLSSREGWCGFAPSAAAGLVRIGPQVDAVRVEHAQQVVLGHRTAHRKNRPDNSSDRLTGSVRHCPDATRRHRVDPDSPPGFTAHAKPAKTRRPRSAITLPVPRTTAFRRPTAGRGDAGGGVDQSRVLAVCPGAGTTAMSMSRPGVIADAGGIGHAWLSPQAVSIADRRK